MDTEKYSYNVTKLLLKLYFAYVSSHISSSVSSHEENQGKIAKTVDICLRVLKESNKSMFDSYSRQEQCTDHIPYYLSGLSRAHFFRQPFSK